MLNHQKPQPNKSDRFFAKRSEKRKDAPKPLLAMPDVKREIFLIPYQRRIFA